MTLEIKVGPPQLAIHQGHTVLITEPDGSIGWPTDMGLYFFDTRMVSAWSISANGVPWDLLNSGTPVCSQARIYLTNQTIQTEDVTIPARTLGLVVSRLIDGGLHEDFDVTNHGGVAVRFNLEVMLRSDFADVFEVKSGHIIRRGRITSEWADEDQCLTMSYGNRDFHRSVSVHASESPSAGVVANGRVSFEVALAPGETWHTCLGYALNDGERTFAAPPCTRGDAQHQIASRAIDSWYETVTRLESSNANIQRLYRQAVDDMAALRLPAGNGHDNDIICAAGLPWFVALFGRDSLIVSLQIAPVSAEFARGALNVLGRWQAKEFDAYRDAEPGKILHELRQGELAHFKLIPHTPYFGTADATPLYLITLHNAWRCTGDRNLVERLMPVAERCLRWIDEWGDRDGDGFQEYQTRSSAGYENMAWKDSGDSVMHADGSKVHGPKALCELQGYVFDAWMRMAEIFDAFGQGDRGSALRAKAAALFERFNATFWDETSGFYAYGLDGDKRPILSVVSNPGHLLWSGLVPQERAGRLVARLMKPDMWSGWGIRTLSSRHPSYNPYSYQNGSVWPHDNGLIAQGFKRYGYVEEAHAIAHDVFAAAEYFALNQLPELYAGVERDRSNFPVQYLGANVPQAWAAGSVFSLLQAMIGFQPDAPNHRLLIDPALPDWLPDLTLRNLQVGAARFDIRFFRSGAATSFEVLCGNPAAVVQQPMTIWRFASDN